MSDQPLDPVQPPSDLPLRDSEIIQGNILAGFNKDQQVFILLQFADNASGRAYLGELTPRIASTHQVATFNAQFSSARRLRGGDDPTSLKAVWLNIGLTHHGMTTLAPGLRDDLRNFFAFREGPAERAPQLRDIGLSDPSRWVFGGKNHLPVDAILTVAADEEDDLQIEVDKMRALAAKHNVRVLFEQRGDTLPEERAGHEHFGFKDGISQPGVRGFHPADPDNPDERLGHPGTKMIAPGEFVIGYASEFGAQESVEWMRDGSFQVFRRLSQDVAGWWAQVTRQGLSLPSDDPMSQDLLAAKLVGRWRSGTPLATAPDRDNRSERDRQEDNNFDFDDDFDGLKTPVFAHIRKMYPRDNDRFGDKTRRIIRRGIPFGLHFDPALGRGHGVDADRGLIFNVFMASIENQFEFLQQSWANEESFPAAETGPDPVIGESPAPIKIQREGRPDLRLDFRRFVHTSGAVYAFAPAISTLRRIASGELGQDVEEPVLRIGGRAMINPDGGASWRLRSSPVLGGKVVGSLTPGTQMTLLDGPRPADGHEWWLIRTDDNRQGWVAAGGLIPLAE
jgi:Dyp-type peroxidase family